MARFLSQAKKGYYKTPTHLINKITHYLSCQDAENVKILDPCAGEGEALNTIGCLLGVKTSQLYANELDEPRAAVCRSLGLITTCGDGCSELHAPLKSFQCLYLNPPYDNEGHGEGRTEFKFLSTVRFLAYGGVCIFVVPLKILCHEQAISKLTQLFNNIRILKFPDADYAAFGQCVFIAYKGRGVIEKERENMIMDLQTPPELGNDIDTKWTIPASLNSTFSFFSSNLTETQIQEFVNTPLVKKELAFGLTGRTEREPSSLMPLRAGHQAVILATGLMDGIFTEPETGNLLVISGKTEIHTVVSTSVTCDDEFTKDVVCIRKTPIPIVIAFDLTASIASGEAILYTMR